jgi:hypothetical protein
VALPEVWLPYGAVETLVSVQAENLGAVVEPVAEKSTVEAERHVELLKGVPSLFVCDTRPSTLELLRDLVGLSGSSDSLKLVAPDSKRVEVAVPELKGKVTQLPLATPQEGGSPAPAQLLTNPGRKVFVGTGRPDPLFGIVDARLEASLNWVSGALAEAGSARKDFEPSPFEKTPSFEKAVEYAELIKEATFLTAVPRGGKVRSVLEDAPFDAVKNGFLESALSPARGLIVGAGGRGYDDTLSAALRSVWNVIGGVRRSGEILLVAECSEGLGSAALDMFVSGRIAGERGRKREKYVPGMEEISYLERLKEEYSLLLLSGLPEVFAKNKLGLPTARGSGEAVGRVLNKLGRTAKVNVVTRAPECRIRSA